MPALLLGVLGSKAHVETWGKLGRLLRECVDCPRLLLTQESPEVIDFWFGEGYERAAKNVGLPYGALRL